MIQIKFYYDMQQISEASSAETYWRRPCIVQMIFFFPLEHV